MGKWFRQAVAKAAAWLFSWFLKREEPKLLDGINIGGINIPLADAAKLGQAVPTVILGIGANKSAEDIVKEIEPSVLPVIEDVANLIYPGAGTAIKIIAFLIEHSKKMNQEETNAWMDRMGAGNQ